MVNFVNVVADALQFGGAPAVALAAMLQIGKTLEADQFAKRIIPDVSKLFSSTDRAMRRSLLENIEIYGQHMDQVSPSSPSVHLLACILPVSSKSLSLRLPAQRRFLCSKPTQCSS